MKLQQVNIYFKPILLYFKQFYAIAGDSWNLTGAARTTCRLEWRLECFLSTREFWSLFTFGRLWTNLKKGKETALSLHLVTQPNDVRGLWETDTRAVLQTEFVQHWARCTATAQPIPNGRPVSEGGCAEQRLQRETSHVLQLGASTGWPARERPRFCFLSFPSRDGSIMRAHKSAPVILVRCSEIAAVLVRRCTRLRLRELDGPICAKIFRTRSEK